MERARGTRRLTEVSVPGAGLAAAGRWQEGDGGLAETGESFHQEFVDLFRAHFHRIQRFLSRLSGESELATDVVQEAFVRLYKRGSSPDDPPAWLITVALNLLRNEKSAQRRRLRLLTRMRDEVIHSDPPVSPEGAMIREGQRRRVRSTLDGLPDRERSLLLLRAEGYSYREIAQVLGLNEASIGTLLARARRTFRETYEDPSHAH